MRSHKHFVLEPDADGITALRGTNGAGKSTIVDSIAWALYGTKPSGVSKASALYREGAEFGKDKCYVIVDFEVNGQNLRIERRMVTKGGALEADLWEISEDDEGNEVKTHLAGSAVTHVKTEVTRRLNMDEKGFLAAILVQQKEVDHLISAGPSERAKVIERLTGISAITAALQSASEEHNSLKKVASLSTVDETEVEKLNKEFKKLESVIDKQTQNLEKLRDKLVKAKEENEELEKKVDEENEKSLRGERLRFNIAVAKAKIESFESELEHLNEERSEKRSKLSGLAAGTDLSEIEPKVNKAKSELRTLELDNSESTRKLSLNNAKIKSFEKILEKNDLSSSEIVSLIKVNNEKIKDFNKEIKVLNSEKISANAEIKKIRKAIDVISKGHGSCPTCLQEVSDVSVAVKSLEKEISSLEDNISEIEPNISDRDSKVESLSLETQNLEQIKDAIKEKSEIEKENISLSESIVESGSKIKAIETELKVLEKVYSEAKYNKNAKDEYERVLSRSRKVIDSIDTLNEKLEKMESEVKDSGSMSPEKLAKLRSKYETARSTYSDLRAKFSDDRGERNLNKERLSSLESTIKRSKEEIAKYKDLLKSVEVAATSKKLIEKFREERIATSIPVIEAFASDLMSRFTQGAFTQLKLDPKFNATVLLSNGSERPVSLLSGGELSAASMSLRLAISMLLNSGSSSNLIILDEVLVSQDQVRAEQMLNTIKEVCKGQVILIAHNDHIDSIADNVIQLAPRQNIA